MKTTILALTALLFSSTLWALDLHLHSYDQNDQVFGEELVEIEILGGTLKHYLSTCDAPGFHFGAEKLEDDIYRYTVYCGPPPIGRTKYIEVREPGI